MRYGILILLFLAIVNLNYAQEEGIAAIQYPLSADNALAIGVQARVDVAGLNIRANPDIEAAMLSQTVANEIVEIVDGSVAAGGYVWWQIQQTDGTVGWVVEQFAETDSFDSKILVQTLFPLCPYTTERLSFITHPYIYTSAHDGTQRCVLYKLQTSSVYTTWGKLNYMVNDVLWSPDGDEFFFIDYAYDTDCCIYRLYSVNVDGSRMTSLTPDSDVSWADWSPDGERIALVLNDQAWVMNRDGTNPVRLSDTTNRIDYVAWYPDNQSIFYVETFREDPNAVQTSTRTSSTLHLVGADLSNPQELFVIDGEIELRQIHLAPDGRHLTAVITEFNEYMEPVGGGAYLYNTETWERQLLNTYWSYLWSPSGRYLLTFGDEPELLNMETQETSSLDLSYASSWSADESLLYSSEGDGFIVYDVATGEMQSYLEEEAKAFESDFADSIMSVREQGNN